MHDLEYAEIWERLARINHFRHCGARGFDYIRWNSFFHDRCVRRARVEEGELGELWKRGDVS